MKKYESKEFSKVMGALAINFQVELKSAYLELVFETLKEYSLEDVKTAAKQILITRKYTSLPTVAEFLDHMPDKAPSLENKAEIECNKVIEYLNIHGGQRVPVFEDPVTQYLMATRWKYQPWAKNVLTDELKWWAKEFKEAYLAYAESGQVPQLEAGDPLKQITARVGKEIK